MNVDELKKASQKYLSFYKTNKKEEMQVRPNELEYPDSEFRYYLKGIEVSKNGKQARFTYLQRRYYRVKSSLKLLFKDSDKKFTIKLDANLIEGLNCNDNEIIKDNAVAIIAFINNVNFLPTWAEIELKEYLNY